MRRRTLLVVLAGLAAAFVALVIFLTGWPAGPFLVTRGNYDRIGLGQSLRETWTILGPPGDYTTGPIELPRSAELLAPAARPRGSSLCQWVSETPQ
jgi:hypothetical protein